MPTPTINVPKTLADPQFLGTTIATLYTAPAGQDGVRLTALLLMNQTTGSVTARVHHVPSGGSAGTSNRVISDLAVPSDGVPILLDLAGVILDPGDTIQALAGAASSIVFALYGIEMD